MPDNEKLPLQPTLNDEYVDDMVERGDQWLGVAFFALGAGYLAPYNAMLTAVDYFRTQYSSSIEYELAVRAVPTPPFT